MAAKAEMALILSLVDEVSKTAKGIKKDLGDVGKEAQGVKGGLAKLGGELGSVFKGIAIGGLALAATAIVGIGTAAFAAGMKVDDAMDSIAISTGATGDELAALGDDFETVFSTIPVSAEDAAGVIGELNKTLGVTGDELTDIATPLAEASRMLGTDATASAKAFGQAMNAWQIDATNAPFALDMLYTAAQKSGIGFDTLSGTLAQFAPQLKTMGFTITESAALLTTLELSGIPAATAMSGLQKAAAAFTKEGVPLQQGLLDVIAAVQGAKTAEEALAIGMETFGAKGAVPMVDAIRSGKFSLDEMTAALQGTEGAIMDASAATQDFPEKLQTLKNSATVALAPIGMAMMDIVTTLVERFTPAFQAASAWLQENLLPVIQQVADAIGLVLAGNLEGAIASLFGDETAAKVMTFLDGVKQVWAFIQDNLTPILLGAGAAIMTAVVPAFIAWAAAAIPAAAATVAAALPVIAIIVAVGAAVALLVKAWQEDWGGIRTFFVDLWETKLQPIFETLKTWLETNIPIAIEKLSGFWTGTLKPAIDVVVGFITGTVVPLFQKVWDWLATTIPAALQTLSDFWTKTLMPAVDTVVAFFNEHVVPLFEAVAELFNVALTIAITALTGLWQKVLLPALTDVWTYLNDNVFPIFEDIGAFLEDTFNKAVDALSDALETLGGWFNDTIAPALKTVWEWLNDKLSPVIETVTGWFDKASEAVGGLSGAFDKVTGWVQGLIDKLSGLTLPDWLTPGSPTPLEMGLWGIVASLDEAERGMRGLDGVMAGMAMDAGMPALAMPGGMAQSRGMATSAAASPRGGGVGGTIQGYSREALRQLFETMAAAITMPLASALAERMQGNSDSALDGTMRALGATV